ncbi:MAG: M23 family metallopeptidase, partial [Actinomycetota bacterium]|nr:M23 family metallopeptidase [Actinomycetota bacterium]
SRDLGWPNEFYINPDFNRGDDVDQSAGNLIVTSHPIYGAVTGYGHLESIGVVKGQDVRAGQQIGVTGNTGYSFGKHLHFFLMFKPYNYGTPTYGCANPNDYMGGIFNLASVIITQLEESGVALDKADLEAIQGIINPWLDQVMLHTSEQIKHYAAELAQVIKDNAYQIKVFTQNVVNPRIDEAILDNRAQEELTRQQQIGGK